MATQSEVAAHLDISVRAWADMKNKLDIPKRPTLDEARIAYIRNIREVAAGRTSEKSSYDLVAERGRLAHHQANVEELKEKQMRGELIASEDVASMWGEMLLSMRAKILALPGKLASTAMGATSLREVEDFAREELHLALDEMNRDESRT